MIALIAISCFILGMAVPVTIAFIGIRWMKRNPEAIMRYMTHRFIQAIKPPHIPPRDEIESSR